MSISYRPHHKSAAGSTNTPSSDVDIRSMFAQPAPPSQRNARSGPASAASTSTSSTQSHMHSHTPHHVSSFPSTNSLSDLSPLPWNRYYTSRRMVTVEDGDEFCVYTAQPPSMPANATPPFLTLLLHGGGHTSMAWACVASYLKAGMSVMSFDLRGHGSTHTKDDHDLSMGRLVRDVINVVRAVYPSPPPLLLAGHSLGGTLAIHVAATNELPIASLAVVDVVEGTALSSLCHMRGIVSSRPSSFPSPEAAVRWSLKCGAMRNVESARASLPDQIVRIRNQNEERTSDTEQSQSLSEEQASSGSSSSNVNVQAPSSPATYTWRTDLLSSEPYWSDWFIGLSSLFLSCPMPKLLVLAGADRMDPAMMAAHMMGKLQVSIVQDVGHSVQEDKPQEMARLLMTFANRYQLNTRGCMWAQQSKQQMNKQKSTPQTAAASSTGTTSSSSFSTAAASSTASSSSSSHPAT